MQVRRIKIISKTATAICFAIGAAVLIYCIIVPIRVSEVVEQRSLSTTRPVRKAPTVPALTAADFESVVEMDLRRPLVDPPITAPLARLTTQPAPAQWRLTGTIIEPGHSYAVLTTPAGVTEVKAAGDRFAGAEILTIADGNVTLRYNGQTLQLKVNKPTGPSGT